MKLSRLPPGFALDTAAQGLALREEAVTDVRREWTDDGWHAEATVIDAGVPYHATVDLLPPPDPQLRGSSCTCGRYRCRHVAALVLATDPPAGPRPAPRDAAEGGKPAPAEEPLDARTQQWLAAFTDTRSPSRGRQFELRYVLRFLPPGSSAGGRRVALQLLRVPLRGEQPDVKGAERYPMPRNLSSAPAFVRRDSNLLRLLEMATTATHEPGRWQEELHALTDHPAADLLLDHLLGSGRLCWERPEQPLTRGPDLSGQLAWLSDSRGAQTPAVHLPDAPDAQLLPVAPPWAVRPGALTLSRVQTDAPAEVTARFLSGPVLPPAQAVALAHAITASGLNLPIPQTVQVREERLPYTPQLHLLAREATHHAFSGARHAVTLPLAELRHAYAGLTVPDDHAGTGPAVFRGGVLTRVTRNPEAEREAAHTVALSGFMLLDDAYGHEYTVPGGEHLLTLGDDDAWMEFMRAGRADLEAQGFTIHVHPDFPLNFAEITDWYGETDDSHGGWFTLDLGIVVDGQRLSLIPILADLIARQPQLFTPEALAELKDDEVLHASLGDGRRVALPAGRVRAILGVLVELNLRDLPPGPLRLPLLDAARVAQLEEAVQARWLGAERLLDLGRRLRDFRGVQDITPPQGLRADLRPYQRQGVAWLQFLREYGMGGILADDMGLGKTVQTLSHLLIEKESGRADRPSLVVAPTSVIGNWQAEAAKFTPDLRVLTLHGKDRRAQFAQIPGHDLILTTYPLLPRDITELGAFEYHLVILDEAQNIKNTRTAAAKAAGSLSARHRLALTGTPLENHLGELWSQFNFLAPGLLHDEKTFRELYRTPIEKRGEASRRQALAARVRPFILRREKRDVARELPPKTEIPVRVTLDGDQRDLYETVRVTTETRVREELRARGLARSTIAILDALLKLRQAVTDPRLVKLDAARGVQNNAKFDWLQAHLPQMIEEGRRVLIFSGFATLLRHLEDWLREQRIPYSMITGSTQDRQGQIDAFQSGKTHVFLITLKAGGVGLNLTAADTVIHYDPWWNPAAEEQATDRAYRIGQDKPVFVYKLIAAGSVEERILDLQARKASLARGILDGGLSDATQLTPADLDRLFAPLEDEEDGDLLERAGVAG
ncbi:DEAD/DEAH box helicase [Deinococcus soli (ex Cha et al. 2016)]|uniref:Superfamily II DNA or RNA helicase n=2 Tax=Deinococcus soli (ex Cha et al. 2016) TaxID=1309411 RepID=A0AAE3XJI4_9DEIO|nr:DEAD/DEAH box helicase [Deinococcus soli (ex Cha et al. 2016)]MDR6220723.1 superfamily II DNA or RNA helicase [Deinococcus soli (ex Cha et al. 2016)]MDR6330750.1 superfamily II DNA or RNA helicase [Deinococcus soli (ex Cha et al. 2016)]MDR6753792.1 superfamily II DNA or RNA helicase [Deinococcus soli (ex Cha et al. 2016)]